MIGLGLGKFVVALASLCRWLISVCKSNSAQQLQRGGTQRRLGYRRGIEPLEGRELMAADLGILYWQNSFNPYDVDADGSIAPRDVLLVANQLNSTNVNGSNGSWDGQVDLYFDVDGDGGLTPQDAETIVLRLNSTSSSIAAGSAARDGVSDDYSGDLGDDSGSGTGTGGDTSGDTSGDTGGLGGDGGSTGEMGDSSGDSGGSSGEVGETGGDVGSGSGTATDSGSDPGGASDGSNGDGNSDGTDGSSSGDVGSDGGGVDGGDTSGDGSGSTSSGSSGGVGDSGSESSGDGGSTGGVHGTGSGTGSGGGTTTGSGGTDSGSGTGDNTGGGTSGESGSDPGSNGTTGTSSNTGSNSNGSNSGTNDDANETGGTDTTENGSTTGTEATTGDGNTTGNGNTGDDNTGESGSGAAGSSCALGSDAEPGNHAPCASDDKMPEVPLSVSHRGHLTLVAPGLLANDSDPEGDHLTAVLDNTVSHGTLDLHNDGSFVYTPTVSFIGTDTFRYKAFDGSLHSEPALVSIVVTNAQPVGTDDSYIAIVNSTLNVNATRGVTTNDTDEDTDPLTSTVVTNVQHGSLTLNSNGSFNYTPTDDFVGEDSFVYKPNDGLADGGNVTVLLHVVRPDVDIDTDSNNDGSVERSDAEENVEDIAPGNILAQNNDDDNHTQFPDYDEFPFVDFYGQTAVDDDLELVYFSFDTKGGDLDGFSISFTSDTKMWLDDTKKTFAEHYVIGTDDIPEWFYVEGIEVGVHSVEVVLKSPQGKVVSTDKVRLSVTDGQLFAYRPQTAPFQTAVVPKDETGHVGIRRNLDDDNHDGIKDATNLAVVGGENDLIRVDVSAGNMIVPGVVHRLVRSTRDINVFGAANRSNPILFANDNAVVQPGTYWVEWSTQAVSSSTLTLQVEDGNNQNMAFRKSVTFEPFSSVVILFNGEFQTATDPPAAGDGFVKFAIDMYKRSGFDVHLFDEDDIGTDTTPGGAAWEEVKNAINERGVEQVAIAGFSHGGGSTYLLSEYMVGIAPQDLKHNYRIPLTGYIDAIKQPLIGAETRRPRNSLFHVNQYETATYVVHGARGSGDDELDRTGLGVNHMTIEENDDVLNFLWERFEQKVEK